MADVKRPAIKRRRVSSSATDMQAAINQPGSIEINVTGAYIIDHEDDDEHSHGSGGSSPDSDHTGAPEDHSPKHHKRDIRLPNHTAVVSHVAADIGGSLAKVVYFLRENGNAESGGRLHFLSFETEKIDDCIEYLRKLQSKYDVSNGVKASNLSVHATGGGAFKFYDRIRERLGVEVQREDEMGCLIRGLDFFITEVPNEVFTYDLDSQPDDAIQFQEPRSDVYPYLLVNIGSGVSMIKVSGPSEFGRIGGTHLGGGTLWGLLSLLTGSRSFDDMLAMADKGDNSAVDLLVGDIYGEGTGYEKIGFSDKTIASSFGKVLKRKREAERQAEDGGGLSNGDDRPAAKVLQGGMDDGEQSNLVGNGRMFKPEDISRSLLYAIR